HRARGIDGLARVIEQLAGVAVPASALESLVLPARLWDYSPGMLDELTSSGEVLWCGAGALAGNDGWLSLVPAAAAVELMPPVSEIELTPVHHAVLAALEGDQALFLRAVADRVRDHLVTSTAGAPGAESGVGSSSKLAASMPAESDIVAAIWDLAFAGLVTNDTLAPVRSRLGGGRTAHARRPAAPRARYGRFNLARPGTGNGRQPPSPLPGRWSRLPDRGPDDAHRALLRTEVLLDRYGILTRGEVSAEGVPGGFSAVYPVLRQGEDAGRYRRGYFVEGLGAAQFGLTGAIDRLRSLMNAPERASTEPPEALVLAATDPANPYGAALPWPERVHLPEAEAGKRGHQPARKAGALVVLVNGECALYVERGGKTLLSFTADDGQLQAAAGALAVSARAGSLGKLHVESADGDPIVASPLGQALEQAGFRPSPRGLRLRA
ncbi:MAG: DEAD/DEAH box helicase, partial [Actinobacteria bacterium]|nr:DEAD/DEAH box helicase [Actinomycetota bacterium]